MSLLLVLAIALPLCASELKPKDHVVFFPSMLWPASTNWVLDIHGWVFEPGDHKIIAKLLGRVLGIKESDLTAGEKAIFHERSQYFLENNERRREITVEIAGHAFALNASKANGHFLSTLTLSPEENYKLYLCETNGPIGFKMLALGHTNPAPYGIIHRLDQTGISVISDIDDTIKISQVLQKHELLKNTFCRPFKPVPGMAKVYQAWQNSGASHFDYLSATPWQLYIPMEAFLRSNGFPAGTFQFRYFRMKDSSFWNIFRSPGKFKRENLEILLKQFPKRRFVLLGDSGESDPEVYGQIARDHPAQVLRIFIRNITGEAAGSPRYQKAFKGVPPEKWQLFKDPEQLPKNLSTFPLTPK